ncbi:MAG: hypothetical protein GYB42_08370 [Alphaproteobacteria bacterium]|nr:hypothetical protein [Alphaproteobacteria bacterium]
MRGALAILLLIAASPQPALAKSDEARIAGQWSFTADLDVDCSFGGTAHLEHVGDGKYVGELTARQSCDLLEEDYLVRQDCKANLFGDQVSVRCRIVEFINGFGSEFYYPDNFTLTISSTTRMYGALVSSGEANPAEWKRAEGGIS